MTPADFLEADVYLRPAPGDEANVATLPCKYDPRTGYTSVWKLSEEELDLLKRNGGHIAITVVANPAPPIAAWIDPALNPLDDNGDVIPIAEAE